MIAPTPGNFHLYNYVHALPNSTDETVPAACTEGFVLRGRLVERVQAGLSGSRLTIISVSPGFGKTTLLSAWLATNKNSKVAWYSLDEDDNEPSRFFTYIAASVLALGSLLETGSANPRELSVALLNDLSEFSSKSIVLVLDDYHHIIRSYIARVVSNDSPKTLLLAEQALQQLAEQDFSSDIFQLVIVQIGNFPHSKI